MRDRIGLWARATVAMTWIVALLAGLATPRAEASAPFVLPVPYRSQFDGSPWAGSNCGPASIAMVLGAYGIPASIAGIRERVDRLQGTDAYDSGTSLETIAAILRERGLTPVDLMAGAQHARWTGGEVIAQLRAGHPVIPEVRYRRMPGHADAAFDGDHYVVLIGLDGGDVVYNDPAFHHGEGNARRAPLDRVLSAMAASAYPDAAVAVAPGPGQLGLTAPVPAVRALRRAAAGAATPADSRPAVASTLASVDRSVTSARQATGPAPTTGSTRAAFAWKEAEDAGGVTTEAVLGTVTADSAPRASPVRTASSDEPRQPSFSDERPAVSGPVRGRARPASAPPASFPSAPVALALLGLVGIAYLVGESRRSAGSLVFVRVADRSVVGRVRVQQWPGRIRWDRNRCARRLPEVGLALLSARPGPIVDGQTTVRVCLVGRDGHAVMRRFQDLDAAYLTDAAEYEVIFQATTARSRPWRWLAVGRVARSVS